MKIDHVHIGKRNLQSATDKINQVIDVADTVANISGDKFIKIEQTSNSTNIGLNVNKVLELVPERSAGGNSIHRAKLTADAGASATITANIYINGTEQTTGDYHDVTVYFRVHPSANMESALPLLSSGEEILVAKIPYDNSGTIESRWYCTSDFWKASICS